MESQIEHFYFEHTNPSWIHLDSPPPSATASGSEKKKKKSRVHSTAAASSSSQQQQHQQYGSVSAKDKLDKLMGTSAFVSSQTETMKNNGSNNKTVGSGPGSR